MNKRVSSSIVSNALIFACGLVVSFLGASIAFAAFGSYQNYSPIPAAVGPSTIFQGDSTKSISSITPSITCLQSGTLQTPAFIQCSASGTTATGSSNPYIDLQYVWTDNNSGSDSFTLPSPIGTRSSSLQNGPEYVQVFRTAGTFTVTLTVSGCTSGHPSTAYAGGGGACNGNSITTASTTKTVVVSTWSGTDYYFNASTGNDANVCSLGSPCQHPSKCATLIEGGSNIRCNFDCGQTFDGTTGNGLRLSANASYSHARVQAGGPDCPGANPIISLASGTNFCVGVQQNGAGGVKSDIVISSITCANSGTYSNSQYVFVAGNNSGGGSVNNVYLDNINAADSLDINSISPVNVAEDSGSVVSTFQGVVLWNVSSSTPVSATSTSTGIIGGAQQWYSIVGGTVQGSGAANSTLSHQIYMHCGGHCTARWVNTGPTCSGGGCTPTRDSCVKTSYDQADGDGSAFTSSYWLVTENFCQSVTNLGGPGNNTLNAAVSTIDQYIQQQNVLSGIAQGSAPVTGQNMAVRDNWACLTGLSGNSPTGPQGSFFVSANATGQTTVLASNVYRNLIYSNRSFAGTNHNPLATYYIQSSESYTLAQQVFDNLFQTDATNNFALNIPSTNFVSKSSFVDYNTYYAPNNAGNFLQNADTGVSFASWQGLGWDAHGVNSNPGWPSPSTCGFGSWPY